MAYRSYRRRCSDWSDHFDSVLTTEVTTPKPMRLSPENYTRTIDSVVGKLRLSNPARLDDKPVPPRVVLVAATSARNAQRDQCNPEDHSHRAVDHASAIE